MTDSRRRTVRTLALTIGLSALYGCSGGLSCGSNSGCTNGYPYPMTAADVPNGTAFVDEGMRVRLTQQALDLLTANLRPLLLGALGTDPANPDVITIPVSDRLDLGGGFSLGVSDNEQHPTEIFIDAEDFANSITTRFVEGEGGEPDGIHLHAENVPVGLEARVFFDASLSAAACDLFGTNENLGDRPWFTTFTLDAIVRPRVGSGAECDNHAPSCLKLSVEVNDAEIGDFSYDSIEVDLPEETACEADGPGPCSEECSDRMGLDFSGDTECQAACFVGDIVTDIAGTLGGLLNNLISGLLPGILENALTDVLDEFDGSPLSAAARLNVATFAPGIIPASSLDLGYAITPLPEAFDVNQAPATPAAAKGMDLLVKTGFEAAPSLVDDTPVPHPCVRHIEGADFTALYGASEFQVHNADPLTGVFDGRVYDLGASVGVAALNQALFAAYNSGALCLEASTESIAALSGGGSDAFQLTAGTIDLLTGGKLRQYARSDAPAIIALAPNQPPILAYGVGDETEGHLKVSWPDVEVSFYVLINERYSRVFAVTADVKLELSVLEDPATRTLRLVVVDGPRVENFVERYNELLPGVAFTEVLESLIGVAFDAALGDGLEFNFDIGPALSSSLGVPLTVELVGIETAPASNREFLNVYLALSSTPPTQARTASVERPRLALDSGVLKPMSASNPIKLRPTGEVRIESDDMVPLGAPTEYFARVDFGAWRGPFRPDLSGAITVRDPKLAIVGAHTVLLRSRIVGEPGTLSGPGEPVHVWVDPEAPRVELVQVESNVLARGWDVGSRSDELQWQWQLDDGPWSEPGAVVVRPLGDLVGRRVAVRAIDAAGNISRPSGLSLVVARQRAPELSTDGEGCSQAHPTAAWLALLGLGVVRRRRVRGTLVSLFSSPSR